MILGEVTKAGDRIDATHTMYPSELLVLGSRGAETLLQGDPLRPITTYGVVLDGAVHVRSGPVTCRVDGRGFFSTPGEPEVVSESSGSRVIVIVRHGFRGQVAFGAIEKKGRLTYIDGCSDSILVYPPRKGDPVLNFLHFPPGIVQTQHTHPSIRLGVVLDGEGVAYQLPGPGRPGWEKPLRPGCVFLLEEQELHSFRTGEKHMDIVAFHPDSDTGPTDANHPMLNRTYLNPLAPGGERG